MQLHKLLCDFSLAHWISNKSERTGQSGSRTSAGIRHLLVVVDDLGKHALLASNDFGDRIIVAEAGIVSVPTSLNGLRGRVA